MLVFTRHLSLQFFMSDWIGLAAVLLLVIGGVYGLSRLGEPRRPITEAEYEKRVREAPPGLSAGVIGLQKILEPGVAKAIAVQQDFRAGHLDKKQVTGEGDEAGAASDTVNRSNTEE
jgi:hypothetical protein